MVDEMYLQKSTQYQGGEYVGADEEGKLYKGIVALMIVGMSKNIPYIIQAIPEVKFSGKWLADKMSENIKNLNKIGFCVRGIVTDNHSANVTLSKPMDHHVNPSAAGLQHHHVVPHAYAGPSAGSSVGNLGSVMAYH